MTDQFRAFEQTGPRYTVHIFYDQKHFQSWCQAHRPKHMVAASAIRGVCERCPVDHRFEANEPEEVHA